MDINKIIKQSSEYALLSAEINNDKISKSIILISKDSFYSYSFAKMLAFLLLSGEEEDEHFSKIMADSHPDVKTYPQKDRLLVADSEDIVMESFIKPIFGNKKVFIIKNFDNSMESAQNKLLKVLEEPPANVYFILTCQNPSLVLPTIKSRCTKLELAKINRQSIEDALFGEQNVDVISAASDGYLGKALELAEMKDFLPLFKTTLSLITRMGSSKEVLSYSKEVLKYKDNIVLVLELLGLLLEDLLAIKANKMTQVRFKEYKNELENVSVHYSVRAICEIQNLLNKATKEFGFNGNVTVIVENLLLSILEVKFVCK